MSWGGGPKYAALSLIAFALLGASYTLTGPEADAMNAVRENRYADAQQLFRRAAFGDDCRGRDQRLITNVNYLREWIDPRTIAEDVAVPWKVSDADRDAMDRAEARDALDEIVRRAASTRITMLNEHHHFPRSRAFAAEVARRLRPLGYDVLATETFTNNPDATITDRVMGRLAKDGYPRQDTGFYSADPVYGSFLRTAMALGYRPVAYETNNYHMTGTPEEQRDRREQDQADNLAAALRRYPHAKFLIYVGFGHLYENDVGSMRLMGARLKSQTGINPLTIDQTEFMSASMAPPRDPFFARVEAKAKNRSVILFDEDRPLILGQPANAIDLQVIHPVLPDRLGRPGWLYGTGRNPKTAPAAFAPKDHDVLLQAFGAKDASDAVPIDQVVWRKGASAPTLLLLPKGRVRYAAQAMPAPVCPGVEIASSAMGG